MDDAAKDFTDRVIESIGEEPGGLANALLTLPESTRKQLSRSIGMVMAGFTKPGWKTLVIAVNEDQGALLLAASPGVTDIEANDIVDVAKDAILASTTLDAPDRSKWS